MSVKQFSALAVFALVALAGCSAKPPVGTLASLPSPVAVDGTVTNLYVPFDNGGNPASAAPAASGELECIQDNSPQPLPAGPTPCTDASTTVSAEFAELPAPEGTYSLWFAAGTDPALKIDDLAVADAAAGTFSVNKTFDSDLTGKHTIIELRMGDFVFATASATGGPQVFAPTPGLTGVSAKGDFDAKTLTLTISGLPANGTYVGRLYTADGVVSKTAAESFAVENGAVTFTSKDTDIGTYAQFHIHVGSSMVNLYKADIKAAAAA